MFRVTTRGKESNSLRSEVLIANGVDESSPDWMSPWPYLFPLPPSKHFPTFIYSRREPLSYRICFVSRRPPNAFTKRLLSHRQFCKTPVINHASANTEYFPNSGILSMWLREACLRAVHNRVSARFCSTSVNGGFCQACHDTTFLYHGMLVCLYSQHSYLIKII